MIFMQDVSDPEGPVHLPDGSWVVTEMGRGCISHISADGQTRREIAHTGRPNGLVLDADGKLLVAESKNPALLKVTMAGDITTIATGCDDMPFLWPNDLCFGPDGALYMTDSGITVAEMTGAEPAAVYEMPIDGRVFRIDVSSNTCTLLDRGLRFANGIAFDAGGDYLYVNETLTGNIYRYRIVAGRVEGERHLFGNVMLQPPTAYGQIAGPDGMAFDVDGNLHVAVVTQGDITVLAPDGAVIQRLEVDGDFPTNLAFAGPGNRRIIVTEGSRNQLLLLETPVAGLPLYS